MQNTIAVTEKRSLIDKFRNYYKEKVIDTGKAAKFEEGFDKYLKFDKMRVIVMGTVATIVMAICPVDGPWGELLTVAATPQMAKLVDLKGKLLKPVVLGGKRAFEANFIGVDGSSKEITAPKLNRDEMVKDSLEIVEGIKTIEGIGMKR